jgi:ArsR family metal-binding transcriptional regulator
MSNNLNSMKVLTTFPNHTEFEKAKFYLEKLSLSYEILSPEIAYSKVGVPAIIVDQDVRSQLYANEKNSTFICSGWVDYQSASFIISNDRPRLFQNDFMGACSIVVLAPCMADVKRIRLIAHLSGDLTEVFPYLTTEMPQGMYNRAVPVFTFMDGYRMVSLYSKRITIAKADEISDAWRLLEKIRCLVNDVWLKKDTIQPSYEMRRKPPALEIYKRLPGLSCKQCGEKTCMAFALRLWSGEVNPLLCQPIFEGAYGHLKEALLEICSSLGLL